MLAEFTVGVLKKALGATHAGRSDTSGAAVVTQGHARFQEAVEQGTAYGVANQVGVTSQAGISVTTPVLTLYNPLGSGKKAVIWYAGASFTVAFATAGAIFVCVGTDIQTAAVTGTLTTAHRNLKLGTTASPAVRTLLAATLPVAPVAIAILGVGLTGAINTTPTSPPVGRWFDGSLIILPGASLSIQTGVASGASGMFCEYIWEEIDA